MIGLRGVRPARRRSSRLCRLKQLPARPQHMTRYHSTDLLAAWLDAAAAADNDREGAAWHAERYEAMARAFGVHLDSPPGPDAPEPLRRQVILAVRERVASWPEQPLWPPDSDDLAQLGRAFAVL